MPAPAQAATDDIDVASLWSVLKRSGPKMLLLSGLVGALTYGGLMMVPSKYKSEAQLRIGASGSGDPRDPKGPGATPDNVTVRVDKEAIASQVVALRSRDLASKLAVELKLNQRTEFNTALGGQGFLAGTLRLMGIAGPRPGETEEERVFNAYYNALQVYQVKDTRVITVEFLSTDGELAARAANRLIELYQEWLRSQGVSVSQESSDWIRPQIEKLAREVSEADAAVENFRKTADIFRTDAVRGTGLNEQQLSDLTTEVTRARTARSEADARARSARELLARGMADAIADVQKSPVIQGLIAQRVRAEREKAEAETSLLPGHPRMKQLNATVADIRRQVNREAAVIVEGLEKEAKVVALREEFAVKSLEDMKTRVGAKSVDVARLANLEGIAKAKRKQLEELQAAFESSAIRKDAKSQPLEAQVIQSARPSSVPHSPKKPQLAALASAATLILGLVLVVTRELAGGNRGRSQPRAAAVVAAPEPPMLEPASPTVAAAPAMTRSAPATPAHPTPDSLTLASAAAVARRLLANGDAQGGYRSVIAGEAEGIDAREHAAEVAATLAEHGKQVVLVDWSFDGRGMSEALGLAATPGILDLIEGRASFDDVIRRLPDGDVHIVACGSARAAGAGKLDADRINLVLDALDEAYDHIIVTGPHGGIVELFLAIQGRFDAGVLVCDSKRDGRAPVAGTFLGYQVADIDVLRLDRASLESGRKPSPARASKRPEHRV